MVEKKLDDLCWVAYSPTHYDPGLNLYPDKISLGNDLSALHKAGFNGIVTYGGDILDSLSLLPQVADSLGFEAIILGIWNPASIWEIDKVIEAGTHDLVIGFCVGNEGLGKRYSIDVLSDCIDTVRSRTGKAVTTTEEFDDYINILGLIELGDWVFPNTHPYWNGFYEAKSAVSWTKDRYRQIIKMTKKFVIFKEVGMPTDGDEQVTEQLQLDYYELLNTSSVKFVYFEAFDQPWKSHMPVEPYWGLFKKDRTPKPAVDIVCLRTY